MLSIIAGKGRESDHIFEILPENSHWCLRERIDSEQLIEWIKECVLVIASVLKVRKVFKSPTLSIPLEMHMCFLSLRLHDDDCFLELWTRDLLIRGMAGKSLTNPKIHHKDTGEELLLEVNILIYEMDFSWALQIFPLFSPLNIPFELIAEQVIMVVKCALSNECIK